MNFFLDRSAELNKTLAHRPHRTPSKEALGQGWLIRHSHAAVAAIGATMVMVFVGWLTRWSTIYWYYSYVNKAMVAQRRQLFKLFGTNFVKIMLHCRRCKTEVYRAFKTFGALQERKHRCRQGYCRLVVGNSKNNEDSSYLIEEVSSNSFFGRGVPAMQENSCSVRKT